jgi:hypothetical protein
VPLVASALGTLTDPFVKFLRLEGIRFDEERLERLFGGRVAFKNRINDAVSCAIARGTAYSVQGAAARLAFCLLEEARGPEAADPDAEPPAAAPRFKRRPNSQPFPPKSRRLPAGHAALRGPARQAPE